MKTNEGKLDWTYKVLVILALIITALIVTKDIVMPILFAALFTIVLLPVVKRIERKLGKVLAITIVLLGAFILLGLFSWLIITQITSLVTSLPDLEEKFFAHVNLLSSLMKKNFNMSADEQAQLLKDTVRQIPTYASAFLLSTSYLIYFILQVPIYIFLFLLYRDRFSKFLHALSPGSALKWIDQIQHMVRSYISGLIIVILIVGALNSIGLLLLGIEHALFFGFFSGLLTMIPYVGIAIGAAIPTLLALVTKDSTWYAVGVIGVHVFVQFLEGNFITPKITGSQISVNALAAIIALLIGGEIWGIAGMILAVPAVGILKIILSYSNTLRPWVIILGDEPSNELKSVDKNSTAS